MWWSDAFCRVFWNGNGPQLEVRGGLGKTCLLDLEQANTAVSGLKVTSQALLIYLPAELVRNSGSCTVQVSLMISVVKGFPLQRFMLQVMCSSACCHCDKIFETGNSTEERFIELVAAYVESSPWLPWACPETGRSSGEHGGAKQLSPRSWEGGRKGECFKACES